MPKVIAETAWHHEGNISFMRTLIDQICNRTNVDIVKLHISLDLDEYMSKSHELYNVLSKWMFNEKEWLEIINIVRKSGKELMLLLNDNKAVNFASKIKPELIEIHSACLNIPTLTQNILEKFKHETKIVLGIGGSTFDEIEEAIRSFKDRNIILMFGFQNYPTNYQDINLMKIRKIQSLFPQVSYGYADHTSWNNYNNRLITLMVAANNMDYIEKHVTTTPGKKRTDFSAAVSIEEINQITNDARILEEIYGNGNMDLNTAEKEYSKFGPNKLAGVSLKNMKKGDRLTLDDVRFTRTKEETDLSQVDIYKICSSKNSLRNDLKKDELINKSHFIQES